MIVHEIIIERDGMHMTGVAVFAGVLNKYLTAAITPIVT
jgi:hypothetical protein